MSRARELVAQLSTLDPWVRRDLALEALEEILEEAQHLDADTPAGDLDIRAEELCVIWNGDQPDGTQALASLALGRTVGELRGWLSLHVDSCREFMGDRRRRI